MTTSLVNVRLNAEDTAKLRELKRRGLRISEIVRTAIRSEHAKAPRKRTAKEIKDILDAIHAKYPDPDDLPPREFDPHDRRAVQEAAARHFGRHNRKKV